MKRTHDREFVIMGTRADPHVERIADEVAKFGDIPVEMPDYKDDTKISLTVDGDGNVGMSVDGVALPREMLIRDRSKIIPGTIVYVKGDDPSVASFVAREWRAMYQPISGLYGDRVVNPLDAEKCLLKPYQQVVAAGIGLILKSQCAGKIAPGPNGGSIPINIMTVRGDRRGSRLRMKSVSV